MDIEKQKQDYEITREFKSMLSKRLALRLKQLIINLFSKTFFNEEK